MGTKAKTISGPYQSYQIRVSVSTIAELQSLSPGVDGAPCFFRDNGQPWYWFTTLPAGVTSSADGSTGATPSRPGGFWVALSTLIPALFTPDGESRYVSKSGSDTLGNGSFFRPFLTIQKALSSITDATSTKPYVVHIGPGTYVDSFTLIPWVGLQGAGRLLTTLAPVQANWIGAAFSPAGTYQAAIQNCSIPTSLVVDFAAVSAVGTCAIFLQDLFIPGATSVTLTGANANCTAFVQNVQWSATFVAPTMTLNNINSFVNAFDPSGQVVYNGNDLYPTTHRLGNDASSITITSTATVAANRMNVIIRATGTSGANAVVIVSGIFANVLAAGCRMRRIGPDANTEFGFGGSTVAASVGAIMLLDGGDNMIFANNSADRIYSVGRPTQSGTRIRVKNQSAFNIDFTFLGAAGTTADATYVSPFGSIDMWLSDGTWMVDNPIQYGSTSLVTGVSPVIPADIAAQAVIQATLKSFSGAQGAIVAKTADRVVGTHAGGGSFRLTSIDPATGATVITDSGTYDWMVKRP